jgi:hypothetical protein
LSERRSHRDVGKVIDSGQAAITPLTRVDQSGGSLIEKNALTGGTFESINPASADARDVDDGIYVPNGYV